MTIVPTSLPSDGNMVWKVTTQPLIEPITVEELKMFARIDGSDEDNLIEGFIKSAREATEQFLRRSLIEQEITLKMDYWPGEAVDLPAPPLLSVTSVSVLDEDDTATAYSSDNYYVVTEAIPGKLVIKYGVTPPDNTERYHAGYRIVYKTGYGSTANYVPQKILDGIKLWAVDIYENRVVRDEPPPEAYLNLQQFRVERIL